MPTEKDPPHNAPARPTSDEDDICYTRRVEQGPDGFFYIARRPTWWPFWRRNTKQSFDTKEKAIAQAEAEVAVIHYLRRPDFTTVWEG